jgi:hypothetical protein
MIIGLGAGVLKCVTPEMGMGWNKKRRRHTRGLPNRLKIKEWGQYKNCIKLFHEILDT